MSLVKDVFARGVARAICIAFAIGCGSSSPTPASDNGVGGVSGADASAGSQAYPDAASGADALPTGEDGPFGNVGGDATQVEPQWIDGSASETGVPPNPAASPLTVTRLRCESNVNPLQVESVTPRLTWELQTADANVRGERQTSFEVLVASSAAKLATDQGDVWSSGSTVSDASKTTYGGAPLPSLKQAFWKVRIRDAAGRLSAWSEQAQWTQGIKTPTDWAAQWITSGTSSTTLPLFRRQFDVTKPVQRAVVSVCGLGQYELRVNGTNVSDGVLDPGWTNFSKTCLYRTYDVTALLTQGPNAVGVLLGNGMYNVATVANRYSKFVGSFGPLKLVLRLHIAFTDGTETAVVTDASWRSTPGPITFSNIYGGEDHNAQAEPTAWDHAGFNDASWSPATVVATTPPALVAQTAPQVKVMKEYPSVKVTEPQPGVFVYDLGQNMSGWPALDITGPAGAVVRLTPGELLNAQGMVTQISMGGGPIWFQYTLRGGADEKWHPRFSYTGFRYVQVDGAVPAASAVRFPSRPVIVGISGQFIHNAAEPAGDFTCSDPDLNHIHAIIVAAILSNLQSIITDCPQREKLGWIEASHLLARAMMFNLDLESVYEQHVANMRDAQTPAGLIPDIAPEMTTFAGDFRDSPEWGSAFVIAPWHLYQMYGSPTVIQQNYDAMKRYVGYLTGKSTQGLLTYGLGDWYDVGPQPPGRSQLTSAGVTATGILFEDATILQKSAALLGRAADVTQYAALAASTASAYQAKFWQPAGYYDRNSQTANAVPLAAGLVPVASRASAVTALVQAFAVSQNRVTSGEIGLAFAIPALTEAGRSDVLLAMVKQRTGPGYLYQVDHGATTLTEAWDSFTHSSQNHAMLGHVERWFWEGLAGFNTDEAAPGFQRTIVRPQMPTGIDSVTASHQSPHGLVESSWIRRASGVELTVSIPVNTTATIYVPAQNPATVTESGGPVATALGVTAVRAETGSLAVDVGSGHYDFVAK